MRIEKSRFPNESIPAWMACGESPCAPRSCTRSPTVPARAPGATAAPAMANTRATTTRLRFDGISIELQRQLQICRFVAREGHRILAGVTRRAIGRATRADGGQQPFEAEITNAVCADVFLNLL